MGDASAAPETKIIEKVRGALLRLLAPQTMDHLRSMTFRVPKIPAAMMELIDETDAIAA